MNQSLTLSSSNVLDRENIAKISSTDKNVDEEDVTESTDPLSDSLSDIKSTHESSFARKSLLKLYAEDDDSSSCSSSSLEEDDSELSLAYFPTPKLDVPVHRSRPRWKSAHDSLSYLKTIESASEDDYSEDDSESSSLKNEKGEDEKIQEEENLRLLCSNESNRIKLLGEGAFGQVWLVRSNHKTFALKVCSKYDLVSEGATEEVLRERHIHSQLHHPFICELCAYDQDEKFLYMLQEYCAGGEMFSLLERKGGTFGESAGMFYGACIADALRYLHDHRIVYRDLKPENIMIDQFGYPKIIDFGCAKQFDDSERNESGGYQTRTMCGTPRFVSPEMIEPEKYGGGHTFSADYWALGILIYEMLMGANPFEYDGMTEMEVYESIVDDGFHPSLSDDYSAAAQDLVSKLLVHDPPRRLGSKKESEVLAHRWFVNIDIRVLRKRPQHSAPWSPDLSDLSDTQYFEDWDNVLESKFSQSYPDLSASQRQMFADF